ncbi:MAG TPA: hypothetical protein VGM62_16165 [Chthoniobacterales bacterium]|jgi:TolB protein
MKQISLLVGFLCVTLSPAWGADRRIAFESNGAVHIANPDVSIVRNLTNGIFPAISPNGKLIAFSGAEGGDGPYTRRVSIVDLATGQVQPFAGIPGDNSYFASWSPDGRSIAFTLMVDGVWSLGLINSDGTGFRFIKKGGPETNPLYSPCWARDGKSVFCHDLTTIYRLSLDGTILSQWRIERLAPNGSMGADGRIDLSADGKRLLLSLDMDEEYDRKDWDGPVPALWTFDLATELTVRLTSKTLFAWDGCWLDDKNFLFVSQRGGEKQTAVYRMIGKDMKRIIENARRPSVSALAPR